MKSVVLAYSGGLDTTYCAIYLSRTLGYQVHLVTVNTGAFGSAEVSELEAKSRQLGVASFVCLDMTNTFYDECIKFLVYGNVLKNGTYPLSVSAERIVQATAIANYARKMGIKVVAHGSTGAGNDQVRPLLFPSCVRS